MTMTATISPNDGQRSRISTFTARGGQSNTYGRGRGRGRGHGGQDRGGRGQFGRGNGRGRGRGRHSRQFNPYAMSRPYGLFTPEPRSYPPEEWQQLTPQQKEAVVQAKMNAGWINAYTPPQGFALDENGKPNRSNSLVSVVQSVIGQVSHQNYTIAPPVPPLLALPPVIETAMITTPPAQAGHVFGRTGQRRSDASSISSVTGARITVNGQLVPEAFDCNGNPL